MRRAWIEMFCKERRCARGKVALHAESVDRNIVAAVLANKDDNVALHAESVDRNRYSNIMIIYQILSLSMRRAWIEITIF